MGGEGEGLHFAARRGQCLPLLPGSLAATGLAATGMQDSLTVTVMPPLSSLAGTACEPRPTTACLSWQPPTGRWCGPHALPHALRAGRPRPPPPPCTHPPAAPSHATQDLDDAVIRRMPRRIFVPLPDAANREKILRVILKVWRWREAWGSLGPPVC